MASTLPITFSKVLARTLSIIVRTSSFVKVHSSLSRFGGLSARFLLTLSHKFAEVGDGVFKTNDGIIEGDALDDA